MKKSLFWLIVIFFFLTTYTPKFDFDPNFKINIKKIVIENNFVLDSSEIKKNLIFLYNENLFLLNKKEIEKNLKSIEFIESFSIKKIYPRTLKIKILEKIPVAILHKKKKKYFITNNGQLINFRKVKIFNNLPTVFGSEKNFLSLYTNLQIIKFPIKTIKSFYFFESGRWDLITYDDKIVKLPIKDYISSLENFMNFKSNINFNKYKIFDYRIKHQIILN